MLFIHNTSRKLIGIYIYNIIMFLLELRDEYVVRPSEQ